MVSALVVRLEEIFIDRVLYRRLLGCRGLSAQNLLDSFQWVLDVSELDPMFRRKLIVATQRLSAGSSLYPVCYELKDVVRGDQFPVTAGGFADIYKGTLYGQEVCIKAIRVYERDQVDHILKRFSKEAILWGQLSHPNTLPVYGLYRLQTRICIVSPWMEAGDITKYLKCRPEAARLPLASLAIDVAQGLSYLHSHAIIHGDLKGPNILIDDEGRARLADFGISSVSDADIIAWTSHSSVASQGGSVRWQAPELFDMETDEVVPNTVASDVYALACVFYEVFTGVVPYANVPRDATIIFKVKSGTRPARPVDSSPCWREWGLTQGIWALMEDCWREDPSERPSVDQVIQRLLPERQQERRSSMFRSVLPPAVFR
ncbi:kinase-like domain-containing protein, partial [Lyophyllum atratum]